MLAATGDPSQYSAGEWANLVGLLIGGGCLLAWTVHLLVSGRRRDPLGVTGIPTRIERDPGMAVMLVLVPILVYVFAATLIFAPLARLGGADLDAPPLSLERQLFVIADAAAKSVTAIVLVVIYWRSNLRERDPLRRPWSRRTLWAVGAALAGVTLAALQLMLMEQLWRWLDQPIRVHDSIEVLAKFHELPAWLGAFTLLNVTVVAPVAEELLFRGVLLTLIWQATGRPWVAIVLTGVLFGPLHGDYPVTIVPLIAFGILLGFVRVYLRSVTLAILVHALFNLRTVVLVLIDPELA